MPLNPPSPPFTLQSLATILSDLRNPVDGCPWDREQDFASIAPYTIEEAYEVADAIERSDMDALRGELGDLLLQVVYHSRIAEESEAFRLDDVVSDICTKMIRRHPHVYGEEGSRHAWEDMKARERSTAGQGGTLDGVALGLPALMRAGKLQKRAARVGFDWPDASGPRAKIDEELAECEAASTTAELEHEIGDVLFSVVNWSRHLGIDPEVALRAANKRFEDRFALVEGLADRPLTDHSIDELEALWQLAKRGQIAG